MTVAVEPAVFLTPAFVEPPSDAPPDPLLLLLATSVLAAPPRTAFRPPELESSLPSELPQPEIAPVAMHNRAYRPINRSRIDDVATMYRVSFGHNRWITIRQAP